MKVFKPHWKLTADEQRAAMIRGLREMATFLEMNPTLPAPRQIYCNLSGVSKEMLATIAECAEYCEKKIDSQWYNLDVRFSENVLIEYYNSREEVCERVQTGTIKVEAKEAFTETIEHEAVEAHEVPVYEYKCPSLLAPAEQESESEA